MSSFLDTGKKSDCVSCGVCVSACHKKAITMKNDEEGFAFPEIDASLCNNCGLCRKKCVKSDKSFHYIQNYDKKIYACRNKDEKVRETSASGGAFIPLSTEMLGFGGAVIGAAYQDDFSVKHIETNSPEGLERLKKSKYVKSSTRDIYLRTEKLLSDGKKVLFSGTPCQVASLYAFLGKDYSTLYTCDIICHGTPSAGVYSKYLDYKKQEYKSDIAYIDFKDKSVGWRQPNLKISFKSGQEYVSFLWSDMYAGLYHKGITTMRACFECEYTNFNRQSDITIGDFWGEKEKHFGNEDNRGTSVIIVNSEKGEELFAKASDNFNIIEITEEEAAQPQLLRPTAHPDYKRRKIFFDKLKKSDFKSAYEASEKELISEKLNNGKNVLKQKIKNILKK